jgi:TPR repeat protein
MRLLFSLIEPDSQIPASIAAEALASLALLHLTSVSCSAQFTMESRQHGMELLTRAYNTAKTTDTDLAITSGMQLAKILETGTYNIPQDFKAAAEWYMRIGDECNDIDAMVEYGTCAEMGYGMDDGSEERAFLWFSRAAEESAKRVASKIDEDYHGEACFNVAEYYEFGKGGVVPNHFKAVTWYRRGVDAGEDDCEDGLERLKDIARIMGPSAL